MKGKKLLCSILATTAIFSSALALPACDLEDILSNLPGTVVQTPEGAVVYWDVDELYDFLVTLGYDDQKANFHSFCKLRTSAQKPKKEVYPELDCEEDEYVIGVKDAYIDVDGILKLVFVDDSVWELNVVLETLNNKPVYWDVEKLYNYLKGLGIQDTQDEFQEKCDEQTGSQISKEEYKKNNGKDKDKDKDKNNGNNGNNKDEEEEGYYLKVKKIEIYDDKIVIRLEDKTIITLSLNKVSDGGGNEDDENEQPCVHVWGEWVTTTEPTCTSEGEKIRTCTLDSTHTETVSIDILDHELTVESQTPPTCVEVGWIIEGCANCEYEVNTEIPVDENAHDLVKYAGQAPTYSQGGWKDYEACTRCSYTTYEELPARKHEFTNYVFDNNATCVEDGTETAKCNETDCNETHTRTMVGSALGHDLEYHQGKAPTCSENGWSAYETCKRNDCDYTTYKELVLDHNNEYCEECCNLEYTLLSNDTYEVSGIGSFTGSVLYIPSTYKGKAVTSIGANAFKYSNLTYIDLGDSVVSIGNSAFFSCPLLETVVFGNSLKSIGYGAFYFCYALTSVDIPDSVTTISQRAFTHCEALQYISIGAGVSTIEIEAFRDCGTLEISVDSNNPYYVDIDGSLYTKDKKTLVQYALGKTQQRFTVPNSVTTIRESSFFSFHAKCKLTEIVIPLSVTAIGTNAFFHCTNLASVYYGGSETDFSKMTIGTSNEYLTNSTWYYYSETEPALNTAGTGYAGNYWRYVDGEIDVWDEDDFNNRPTYSQGLEYRLLAGDTWEVTGIGTCTDTDLVISAVYQGKKVTSIGESAFNGCTNLTSVVIGDSVVSIGNFAFADCDYLTNLVIPNSVITIGEHAFFWCERLQNVEIPNSVTTIGALAFRSCYSLNSVIIPASTNLIGNSAFFNCISLTNINVDKNNNQYKDIDGNLYSKDGKLLIQYAIGKPEDTFAIPNSVLTIGNSAFYSCSNLTYMKIPDSVTSIEGQAFESCKYLTTITIPNSVTSIGLWAFASCNSLQFNEYGNCKYLGNKNNSYVALIQKIGYDYLDYSIHENTKIIADYALSGCSNMKSITIPDSVTSIGNNAFSSCTSLTSVVIPNSVTILGNSVFYECSNLKSVIIGDSITSISNGLFSTCSSLTSVVIGNSVTSIGSQAFLHCDSLTNIVLPDSITEIKEEAFIHCNNLKNISLGNSIVSIGDYAFYGCANLNDIIIPNSITKIGDMAFYGCNDLNGIYYKGTPNDWNKINFIGYNDHIINAKRYYYSETKPTNVGNYWHYDENSNPIVW